jgi:transposase-like protein
MRFALSLYIECLGFHSIGRLLNVSYATAINLIKKFGLTLSSIRNSKTCQRYGAERNVHLCQFKKTINEC